eukprot:s9513_g2.t1
MQLMRRGEDSWLTFEPPRGESLQDGLRDLAHEKRRGQLAYFWTSSRRRSSRRLAGLEPLLCRAGKPLTGPRCHG